MKIGVPKEIKTHEYRVGLTPGAVREYVAAGHSVLVEHGAGLGIGADGTDYQRAGAEIAPDASAVFAAFALRKPLPRRPETSGPMIGMAIIFTPTA